MAAFQNWYSDREPYVHDLPGEDKEDNFQPFFITKTSEGQLNKDYNEAMNRIEIMAQKAKDYEDSFFLSMQWGVDNTEDFSRRFLAMPEFQNVNKKDFQKVGVEDSSLFQQIRWVLNSPEVYRIINKRDEEFFSTLQTTKSGNLVHSFFTRRAIPIIQNVIERNTKEYIVNNSEAIIAALTQQSLESGRFNLMKAKNQSTRAANKEIKRLKATIETDDKALSKIRDQFRETIPVLIAPIDQSIIHETLSFIKRELQKIPDEFFNELENATGTAKARKTILIADIVKESERFFTELLSNKKSSSLPESNVTGDIAEFSLEISSKAQEAMTISGDLTGVIAKMSDIKAIGEETSTGPYWNQPVKLPIDLQIKNFLFQVKNHRSAILGGEGAFNQISLHSKKTSLQRLLTQIQDAGAMSEDNINKMMYSYANFAARGKSGEIGTIANLLVNWAVEFFVRSDTVTSLLDRITGLPIPQQPLGGAIGSTHIPLNHFWIIGNKLVGVSDMLYAALRAMQANSSIESWYTGTIKLTPPSIDMTTFTAEKWRIRSLHPNWSGGSGQAYGLEVLIHGKVKGAEIVEGSRLSDIKINLTTLEQILGAFK